MLFWLTSRNTGMSWPKHRGKSESSWTSWQHPQFCLLIIAVDISYLLWSIRYKSLAEQNLMLSQRKCVFFICKVNIRQFVSLAGCISKFNTTNFQNIALFVWAAWACSPTNNVTFLLKILCSRISAATVSAPDAEYRKWCILDHEDHVEVLDNSCFYVYIPCLRNMPVEVMVFEFVYWNIPNIINLAPVCLFADVRDARWSSDSWLQGPCEFSVRNSEKVTLLSLSINIYWRSSRSQTTRRKLYWLDCSHPWGFSSYKAGKDILFWIFTQANVKSQQPRPLPLSRFKCSNSSAEECFGYLVTEPTPNITWQTTPHKAVNNIIG